MCDVTIHNYTQKPDWPSEITDAKGGTHNSRLQLESSVPVSRTNAGEEVHDHDFKIKLNAKYNCISNETIWFPSPPNHQFIHRISSGVLFLRNPHSTSVNSTAEGWLGNFLSETPPSSPPPPPYYINEIWNIHPP